MQLILTDIRPIRARRSDPMTSHHAATRAGDFASSHGGRIVAALRTHGPKTAAELATLIGLTVVQIDRRTCELERLAYIRVCIDEAGKDLTRGGFRVWEAM